MNGSIVLLFSLLSIYSIVGTLETNWKTIFKTVNPKEFTEISPNCANDTKTWISKLQNASLVGMECLFWKNCSSEQQAMLEEYSPALKQLDAFGKLPAPGMLELMVLYDGSYQECERISGQMYETNYCYLELKPGRNISCDVEKTRQSLVGSLDTIRLAVCMPRSCNESDLTQMFNEFIPAPLSACSTSCSYVKVEKDLGFWMFSIFFITLIYFSLFSTLVDYLRESVWNIKSCEESNIYIRLLLCFSFWSNSEQLLSVKQRKPGVIKCLDCIRTLSMMWVVNGHTFLKMLPPDDFLPIMDFSKIFWNHLITNATLAVDTFFVLSGVVVSYLFFKHPLKLKVVRSPLTWIMMYIHRYLRLTPSVMIFIGVFTVYSVFVQGPYSASISNLIMAEVENCKHSWWRNLLYINNFGDIQNGCYVITWYLAVDTQLFLIAPIFLIVFYFSLIAGIGLVILGCLGSFVITYVQYYNYDLAADFLGSGDVLKLFNLIYSKPWIRCPPYLFGIITGYMLAIFGTRSKIRWPVALLAWMVTFLIMFSCIFSNYDYDNGAKWSIFSKASFNVFSRLGWSVAVCWIISANHMGWGGPNNNFMSHPIWQPFGRLSYCAYIVHWFVLYYFFNLGNRHLHYNSAWDTFLKYSLPATVITYVVAFFWSCLIEVPSIKLEKLLMDGLTGRKDKRELATFNNDENMKTKL